MLEKLKSFYERNERTALILFFVGGFIWDSLTLQRIDHFYSNFVLFTYLLCLMVSLYIFNLSDDGHWKGTFLEKYEEYAPLAVQFFLGGLCSAYVIFFFRSVSLTRTVIFFILLIFLMISNELFKHRLSNKYLQFGALFFVCFTFFTFIIPVFFGVISTTIFIISGLVALGVTMLFIMFVYRKSPSTRHEVNLGKLSGIIITIYFLINVLYYFNMIPPVPLALETGIMAYNVEKTKDTYIVSYDPDKTYKIWRSYNHEMGIVSGEPIYAFTSIFAPTNLKVSVAHRWKWYDPEQEKWQIRDEIGYEVYGGRDGGYRGFTYKTNLQNGYWEIDVVTSEGLIIGTIDFRLTQDSSFAKEKIKREEFN